MEQAVRGPHAVVRTPPPDGGTFMAFSNRKRTA